MFSTVAKLTKIILCLGAIGLVGGINVVCAETTQNIVKINQNKKDSLTAKTISEKSKSLILFKVKFFTKPQMDSPLSKCKLLTSTSVVTPIGSKASVRMISERTLKGINKKIPMGVIIVLDPIINGTDIEISGKISIVGLSILQPQQNESVVVYNAKCHETVFKLNITEQDKFYELTVKTDKKILGFLIKAILVDNDGVPIKAKKKL